MHTSYKVQYIAERGNLFPDKRRTVYIGKSELHNSSRIGLSEMDSEGKFLLSCKPVSRTLD